MSVSACAPAGATQSVLAGADFADAYQVVLIGGPPSAEAAARRIFQRSPGWVAGLIALRNRLGALIGLKGAGETPFDPSLPPERRRRIGIFPIVSEMPDRVVLGFDDWHLDFRVVVDVHPLDDDRQRAVLTTLVRTHGLAGRAYLTLIMPFHRAVARALLAKAARPDSAGLQ